MTRPTQPLRLLQLGAIVMALIIATLVLAALIYVREQSRREHTDAVQDLAHAVSLALDAWVGTIDYGLQVSADEIGHQTGTHGADAAAINRFLAPQQERFPYIACCARPTPRAKRSGAGAWTPRSVPAWPIRVFGSMRRGDGSDDSDVDLLVTLSPRTSGLALGGLLLDAQELLGRLWMSSPKGGLAGGDHRSHLPCRTPARRCRPQCHPQQRQRRKCCPRVERECRAPRVPQHARDDARCQQRQAAQQVEETVGCAAQVFSCLLYTSRCV